ncbi:hypothetical protein [Haloferula sargassicola]
MKRRLIACLGLSSLLLAAEDNPFVSRKDPKSENSPAGEPRRCEFMLEHLLVDSAKLMSWEHEAGEPSDEQLHQTVAEWVRDGSAVLDHTAWVAGADGGKLFSDQILEQIYATEVLPGGKGAWPFPTSFETRNCGHSFNGWAVEEDGKWKLAWEAELVRILSRGRPFSPIAERTCEPGDVFIPTFGSLRASAGGPSVWPDPFGEKTQRIEEPTQLMFEKGGRYLWGRSKEPRSSATRLVFVRARVDPEPVEPEGGLPSRIKLRVLRVDHTKAWEWLNAPDGVDPLQAWEVFSKDPAALAWSLDGWLAAKGRTTAEQIEEYCYPTEYIPGMKWEVTRKWEEADKRGEKAGIATKEERQVVEPAVGAAMAATPTSFETRNIGVSFEAEVEGGRIHLAIESVAKVGDTALHRIEDGGEWRVDMTMPEFGHSMIQTQLPVQCCGWTLVGVGGEFLEGGVADAAHRLMYFVKLE